MPQQDKRAGRLRLDALSKAVRFPAERLEDSPNPLKSQVREISREHERQAHRCALAAHGLRGADAFAQVALARFHASRAIILMGAAHV